MWNFIANIVIYGVVVSVCSIAYSEAMCTTTYGGEPCPFVPAPAGRMPPCARPGDTFCEYTEHYPMQHIRYLIDKWGYDYSTLFSDETRDEYSTYFTQPDYHGYRAPAAHTGDQTGYTYNYPSPEPIYIPKPASAAAPYAHPSNKYIPPSAGARANYTDGFAGYPDRRQPLKYPGYNPTPPGNHIGNHNGYRSHAHHGYFMPSQGPAGYHSGYHGSSGSQQLSYYDPNSRWRYTRDNKNLLSRTKRSTESSNKRRKSIEKKKTRKKQHFTNENKNATNAVPNKQQRTKRQTALGGAQQLCPTRSQYITPRAALNNQGNWMYVVNLQEMDNRYTQLVRSESCVSQQCNGLCSVPTGYTARCEQRYVQKRLVALEGAGQNLYTDVFWFPSCCVCTFTNG